MFSVFKHFKKYKTFIFSYFGIVAVLTAGYYFWANNRHLFITPTVNITVENNQRAIYSLDQERQVADTQEFSVNNVEFVQSIPLKHTTLGEFEGLDYNFFLSAETEFEVLEAGEYMFTIYADDGYRLKINGEVVMEENRLKKMNEFKLRDYKWLNAGKHSMEIELFQNGVFSGLVAYYRRIEENPEKPVSRWEYLTRFGQGKIVGEDDEHTRFSLPNP